VRGWITRRVERWTPKFREFETSFPRRCVFVGTSNPRDVLADPEGHRRWLPLDVTQADDAALAADRDQLWAEGVALWRAGGVQWAEAQALAREQHEQFEERDEWLDLVAAWLDKVPAAGPGEVPSPLPHSERGFALHEVARGALGLDPARLGSRETKRITAILRKLKFANGQKWVNGKNLKRWQRA